MSVKDAQKCGAKTKGSGKPCQGLAMSNGKCRVHGGKTPKGLASPHTKHGKYSKYLSVLPEKFASRANDFLHDPALIELREAVSVQKVRVSELFAELDEREPVEVWRNLRSLYLEFKGRLEDMIDSCEDQMKTAQALSAMSHFEKMLLDGCAAEEKADMVWRKIEASQDRLRKLDETESKRLKDSGEYVGKEGFAVYNLLVQQIIIENVPDAAIRNNIAEKFVQAGI